MFDFTEPIAQRAAACASRNALTSAAISIGIALRRPGAVRFDVADRSAVDAGVRERLDDHPRLSVHARRGVPGLHRAVVVDRGPLDDRQHAIAIGERAASGLSTTTPTPSPEHRPAGLGVERAAVAVGRQNHRLPGSGSPPGAADRWRRRPRARHRIRR